MTEISRESSMKYFAMNLLVSDDERKRGEGVWTLGHPAPVVGMDGKCQKCRGMGRYIMQTVVPNTNPPQVQDAETPCDRCAGTGKDGTPAYTIEEFVVNGDVVQSFCRDKNTTQGERIVHMPLMVHSAAAFGPRSVWQAHIDAEPRDSRETLTLVVDVEGNVWKLGETIPAMQGRPDSAKIVRMFNAGDMIRIYCLPEQSQQWDIMRADLRRHPQRLFGETGEFGLLFVLWPPAIRIVRTTSNVVDYQSIKNDFWEASEKSRLGIEDPEEDDDDDDDEDDEDDEDNKKPVDPVQVQSPPFPVPIEQNGSAQAQVDVSSPLAPPGPGAAQNPS